MRRAFLVAVLGFAAALISSFVPPAPGLQGQTPGHRGGANGHYLTGGPRGAVKTSQDLPIGGLMVQLISEQTSVRTTVYTDQHGRYEFPTLDRGEYTLRLARPIEFRSYRRDDVRIDRATVLADIVVDRVTGGEYVPPAPDILPQLSEAEWLANLEGTAQEKKAFVNACGASCHGFQMQMRARFSEASWRNIVARMGYTERILVQPPGGSVRFDRATQTFSFGPGREDGRDRFNASEREMVIKWLSRVRGPDAKDPPIKPFPRPTGAATRAVVTEYELPWELANVHDVAGDADGNIWFTINRSPFIGKLDPTTAKVTTYRVPQADGMHPGLHWIEVAKNGNVWVSDTWSRRQVMLNPRTGEFSTVYTGQHGNLDLAPDGKSLWHTDRGKIKKWDTATMFKNGGMPVMEWALPTLNGGYGNFLSRDGNYFGAGGSKIIWMDIRKGEVREAPVLSGNAGSGRGDFDPDGNVWVGSKLGQLIRYDPKANVTTEYSPPTPYVNFYTARTDRNGEVWAGEMHGGKIARFNPRTEQWIEYVLPTAWSQDYHSWIDNSTDPVTYWYGDQYGYIVRVQPRSEVAAQAPAQAAQQPAAPSPLPEIDEYDRVAQLWYRQRLARSGPARGQEIYYMSCWMCHNEYTIAADPKNHAPSLKDLFTSAAVTDQAVMAKIRAGGPRMPAYAPGLLSDRDLRDLVAYLRDTCGTIPTDAGGGGCFDERNPPPNPRYKAK
jgi:virginiamycin B lyase